MVKAGHETPDLSLENPGRVADLSKRTPAISLEVFPPVNSEEMAKLIWAKGVLLEELNRAHGPYTGWGVACLLQTPEGYVLGHNYEHSETRFDHAEELALEQLAAVGNPSIDRIFMAGNGGGSMRKEKQICPCFNCYHGLRHHLSPSADMVIFTPGTFERAVLLLPEEYREAYEPKPYSELISRNKETIVKELLGKTILTEEDAKLLTDLRLAGLETGVSFFLTGSASGRGWTSRAINRKLGIDYRDLDIIAKTGQPPDVVAEVLAKVADAHYLHYQMSVDTRMFWRLNTSNEVYILTAENRAKIELTVTPILEAGFTRKDYHDNNFFHQLS